MNIRKNIAELIGSTPLVELVNYEKSNRLDATILAKLEYLNPAGSVKDRVALYMIDDAEQRGLLKPGATIIEPTSGNTGIGLAAIAASRGYRLILTMPETMSVERRRLLAAYGAELVLTDGAGGMTAAIAKANELAKSIPGSFIPGQSTTPRTPARTTKRPVRRSGATPTAGSTSSSAGAGTGGTISGTGRYLKRMNPDVKIVAFEPSGSPYLTEGRAGAHGLQGIGAASSRTTSTFRS